MKVIDLFCGCGGFSLGFEAAGFKIIMGIDNWDVACESYQTNFPRAEVICEDIASIDPSTLPKADVIIGSPPCQEFSVAKNKRTEDSSLINKFFEIVDEIQPKYVVMENVPIAEKYVPAGWKKGIYLACNYGVPQIRRRLFAGNFPEPEKHPVELIYPTVLASEYKGLTPRVNCRLGSVFNRKSMIPEMLLVQTFPLDYYVYGTYREQSIQIGNAVPPIMAYYFAKAIKEDGTCMQL